MSLVGRSTNDTAASLFDRRVVARGGDSVAEVEHVSCDNDDDNTGQSRQSRVCRVRECDRLLQDPSPLLPRLFLSPSILNGDSRKLEDVWMKWWREVLLLRTEILSVVATKSFFSHMRCSQSKNLSRGSKRSFVRHKKTLFKKKRETCYWCTKTKRRSSTFLTRTRLYIYKIP